MTMVIAIFDFMETARRIEVEKIPSILENLEIN